jgi:hypothetical protein
LRNIDLYFSDIDRILYLIFNHNKEKTVRTKRKWEDAFKEEITDHIVDNKVWLPEEILNVDEPIPVNKK